MIKMKIYKVLKSKNIFKLFRIKILHLKSPKTYLNFAIGHPCQALFRYLFYIEKKENVPIFLKIKFSNYK